MRVNVPAAFSGVTHEGAPARRMNDVQALRRSVMSCLLWEREAYESGQTIAQRITDLAMHIKPEKVAEIAIEARTKMHLRHVPLLLARVLAKRRWTGTAKLLAEVIQRPDELTEFLAIYWKDDANQPLSAQVKKGLAKAFGKFNEYQLAKWNKDGPIKLRDVLFLTHAKPADGRKGYTAKQRKQNKKVKLKAGEKLYKRIVDNKLASPETWENRLSRGENKADVFTSLIKEGELGGLALLRNLRGMQQSGVKDSLIRDAITKMSTARILPFRFIAAARYAPQLESELEGAMLRCAAELPPLRGMTIVLVDVSGSMKTALSGKSDMLRSDAASGVAMIAREICESCRLFTFSEALVEIPPRHGFALRDAIHASQPHSATLLGQAVAEMNKIEYDRLIVITDEQSQDRIQGPRNKGYMINVASARNGVGYGAWTHIDGFSESVIRFIQEVEGVNESSEAQ